MAKTPLNKDDVETIVQALTVYEASLRRAINSKLLPGAKAAYAAELSRQQQALFKITQPE